MPKEFNYYQDLRKLKKYIFFSGKPEYWKIRQLEEAGFKKSGRQDRQTSGQADERYPSHCLKIILWFHLENSFNL